MTKAKQRESGDAKILAKLRKRLRAARQFPVNTCPSSRHVQIIGEALARGKPYPMLTEEPEHCAISLLATVVALYEARLHSK